MPDPVSPVAVEFAKQVAPAVVASLVERKDAIVADAGNLFMRQAVRLGWPVALREVPNLAETGADAMLDRFGTMTIADIAGRLVQHNEAKHRADRTHPSVAAAAACTT